MHVNDSVRRNIDDGLGNDLAVADHDHDIGVEIGKSSDGFGTADAFGLIDGQVETQGGGFDG